MPAPVDFQQDEAEYEYSSKTLTAEQILEQLEKAEGGDKFSYSANTTSYAQEPGTEPPAEPKPAAPATPKPPIPPAEPSPVAAPAEPTPAAAAEPAATPQEEEDEHLGRNARRTRKLKAQELEIARLQRELEEAKKQVTPKPAEPPSKIPEAAPAVLGPAPTPADDPEPDPEKYAEGVLDRAFLKDLQRWTIREDRRQEEAAKAERDRAASVMKLEEDAKTAKTTVDADREAIESRWQAQMSDFRKEHPDLDEVFNKSHPELVDAEGKLRPLANPQMWNTLRDLDDGVEIGYWLATHPEDAADIAELTRLAPTASPREIRRAYQTTVEEFAEIRKELGKESRRAARAAKKAESAVPAKPAEPAIPAVKPNGAVPQTAAPPAAPEPPKAPRKPLPEPITPVGSRGGGAYKTLRQLDSTPEGRQILRDMDTREYTRRIAAGEGGEE